MPKTKKNTKDDVIDPADQTGGAKKKRTRRRTTRQTKKKSSKRKSSKKRSSSRKKSSKKKRRTRRKKKSSSRKKSSKKKSSKKKAAPRRRKKKSSKKKKAAPRRRKKKSSKKKRRQRGGLPQNKKGTRYFKIIYDGQEPRGRFSGKKPKQAANKGLTSILKTMKGGGKGKKVNFEMVECTRGRDRKHYKYVGERKKLKDPMVVHIKGKDKPIVYKYKNYVRKDK